MNQLPKVIKIEIYEFARGDRKFWKQQMNKVIGAFQEYIRISPTRTGFSVRLQRDREFYVGFWKYTVPTFKWATDRGIKAYRDSWDGLFICA